MTKPRGGDGQFTRSPDTAARDAEACRLRAQNLSYQDIADRLGYASKSSAHDAVQRALKATVQEPADEVRQLMRMQLDELARRARAVADATHYVVDNRGVVVWDGMPLVDHGPILAAVDRLLKIQESLRKLDGLDTPVKQQIDVNGGVRYEVVGIDPNDLT
ncbi:hypothetical protein [Nonomuraea sp. bgisy101]|uniref:hypothetical protein n=1 Tax=Nonomuraea sp. bgisy101 TaxID=3413784 RepID=UPI003D74419C